MRNALVNCCGKVVVLLSIVWGNLVVLYSVVDKTTIGRVYIQGFYTIRSRSFYQGFTTSKTSISYLLTAWLYPLSTAPIKISTK
jgi:hypothetical protein